MTNFEMVKEFADVFHVEHIQNEVPLQCNETTAALRLKLLWEEFQELTYAMAYEDVKQVAKELADLLYVTYGTANAYGIPMDEVFTEVHKSNMSKMPPDGVIKYREDGKILKGDWYKEPDLESILKPRLLSE